MSLPLAGWLSSAGGGTRNDWELPGHRKRVTMLVLAPKTKPTLGVDKIAITAGNAAACREG
jgi:hypothetical protein